MSAQSERELSQAERRVVVENDLSVRQRQSGTFHAFAIADAEMQGRHAAVTSTVVVGSTEQTKYPGAGQVDPVGPEPLIDGLSAAPLVGEPHEIAASIATRRVENPSAVHPVSAEATGPAHDAPSSPGVERRDAGPPSFNSGEQR
jgi:hypothetical protein